METIMANNNWKLVNLPSGSKPVGCKWKFQGKFGVMMVLYRQNMDVDLFDRCSCC